MNRRLYDGGVQYAHDAAGAAVESVSSACAAWGLGLFQIPFIFNFFWSIWRGKPVGIEPVGGHDARVVGAVAAADTATS